MIDILCWESDCNNQNKFEADSGLGYKYKVIFDPLRMEWVAYVNNGLPGDYPLIEIHACPNQNEAIWAANDHWKEQFKFISANQLEWIECRNLSSSKSNPVFTIAKNHSYSFTLCIDKTSSVIDTYPSINDAKRNAQIIWISHLKTG